MLKINVCFSLQVNPGSNYSDVINMMSYPFQKVTYTLTAKNMLGVSIQCIYQAVWFQEIPPETVVLENKPTTMLHAWLGEGQQVYSLGYLPRIVNAVAHTLSNSMRRVNCVILCALYNHWLQSLRYAGKGCGEWWIWNHVLLPTPNRGDVVLNPAGSIHANMEFNCVPVAASTSQMRC